MRGLSVLRVFIIILAVSTHLYSADNYLLKTYLFRGISSPQSSALEKGFLLDRVTHPNLFSAINSMMFREVDSVILIADALMNALDYESVEVFHLFARKISDSGRDLCEPFVVEPGWAFTLDIKPQPEFAERPRFRAVLKGIEAVAPQKQKTQSSDKVREAAYRILESSVATREMPLLFDQELSVKIADPVFCIIPYREGSTFILAFFLEEVKTESKGKSSSKEKSLETKGAHSLREVLPHYPYDLRERKIEGTVRLRVSIDPDGNLVGIRILKSLHPFLDQSSVWAAKQWTFSPALEEGKAVYGQIDIDFRFDRQAWLRMEAESGRRIEPTINPSEQNGIIDRILNLGAAYSQKLAMAAYDFVCEETIKEIVYPTWVDRLPVPGESIERVQDMGIQNISGSPVHVIKGSSRGAAHAPVYLTKKEYKSDFQFIRKNGELSARRLPSPEQSGYPNRPEDAHYSAIQPFSLIGKLLSPAHQHLFYYVLRDEDTIKGRKAWVIEALPKSGFEYGIESARIWLEKETGKVMRAETKGAFLDGFEAIINEATRYALQPEFLTTYSFQVEKSNLIFPDQIHVQIYYPAMRAMTKKSRKIDLRITYEKYKFFKVETVDVIKAEAHEKPTYAERD